MPFIGNFFYPDKVEMAPTPNLGDMIAKAVQMRRANEAAKMQAERDKMGMELDRMKLSGMVESQKKEKAMATSFGELAKAYQASQGGPSKLPDATPNFAALYGSTPGMGAMGLPGIIPTTVATQGMNQAMSIEDLQKQMFLKVAEMGNPKDQLDAIQALVPQQRGRSAEDQIMIDDNRFKQRLVEQKNKLDAATATLQETFKFKDRSREDAQAHAASIANLQAQNTTYNNMLRLAQQRELEPLVEEIGSDGKMYLRRRSDTNYNLAGVGGGIPQPGGQSFNPPTMPRANVGASPPNASTYTPDQAMTDDVVNQKVGGDPNATFNPPANLPGFNRSGDMTGVVDTTIPPVDQKPSVNQPGQPFTPAPKVGNNNNVFKLQQNYDKSVKAIVDQEQNWASFFSLVDDALAGKKSPTGMEMLSVQRAKMLDPTSVVREGEVFRYLESMGYGQRLAQIAQQFEGAKHFTREQLLDIRQEMSKLYNASQVAKGMLARHYDEQAQQYGGKIIKFGDIGPDAVGTPGALTQQYGQSALPLQSSGRSSQAPEWAKGWRSGTKNGVRIYQNPVSKKVLDADGREVK